MFSVRLRPVEQYMDLLLHNLRRDEQFLTLGESKEDLKVFLLKTMLYCISVPILLDLQFMKRGRYREHHFSALKKCVFAASIVSVFH